MTDEAQDRHPGGRPSKYRPEYCQAVEALGRQGKSQEQIAAMLDVDPKTLRDWAEAHEEFSLSLTRAKMFELAWWEDTGQSALFADKFQAAVWSKSMSSRFKDKYTEKVQQEQFGKNGGPVEHKHVVSIERHIVDPQN